jgi:hypothetical protein
LDVGSGKGDADVSDNVDKTIDKSIAILVLVDEMVESMLRGEREGIRDNGASMTFLVQVDFFRLLTISYVCL